MKIPGTILSISCALTLLLAPACFDPFSRGTRGGGGEVPENVSYSGDVYPILLAHCSVCHSEGGIADTTDYILTSDAAADYEMISALLTPGDPEGSKLLIKASGRTSHGGSTVLPTDSIDYQTIAAWIADGASNN